MLLHDQEGFEHGGRLALEQIWRGDVEQIVEVVEMLV